MDRNDTLRLRNLYLNRHGQFSLCCKAAGIEGDKDQTAAAKLWNSWIDMDPQPSPLILKAYDPDEWRKPA